MITSVYPNSIWLETIPMGSVSDQQSVAIDLSQNAKQIMVWAQIKMYEEARMQSLAKQHPAVAEALMLVRHAEERLQVVVELTKDNNV
jgi:hypothetical protein